MDSTRLIMFEGLPGSGKSTNSYFSYMQLEQNGETVKWIHEVAHPHPLMPEFDNWATPLDKYINNTLRKWIHFAKTVQESSEIFILDSGIFQCHIFNFLLRNAPYNELKIFVDKLISIVKPLNPSLIYLYRENVEDSLDFLKRRSGTQFMERIWERDKTQPYYVDKQKGAEGLKQFLRDYSIIARQLYDAIDCRKILMEITAQDWILYENTILSFLGTKRKPYPNTLPINGIYRNEVLNMEINVNGLSIKDPEGITRTLTPKSSFEFYVECLPVILRFDELDKIIISGGQIIAQWTTLQTQFVKI